MLWHLMNICEDIIWFPLIIYPKAKNTDTENYHEQNAQIFMHLATDNIFQTTSTVDREFLLYIH